MSPDKLATMANQIGRFFASQKRQDPVAGVADHLRTFWDPRMRQTIVAYVDDDAIGLDPTVREAVRRLRDGAPVKPARQEGVPSSNP